MSDIEIISSVCNNRHKSGCLHIAVDYVAIEYGVLSSFWDKSKNINKISNVQNQNLINCRKRIIQ